MPLTPDEISELLSRPLLGHLAVLTDGKPHVTPIWVYYDGDLFYFTTRLSRVKGKAVSKNGRVALSIATNERPYRAIVVEGEARVVEKDKWELLRKISTKYGREERGSSIRRKNQTGSRSSNQAVCSLGTTEGETTGNRMRASP